MNKGLNLFATVFLLAAAGCGATGQEEISYPIQAQGQAPAPFMAGAWQVNLDVAQIGFGPIYFCASASSSRDTCPTAVAELTAAVTVDARSPQPQSLGQVNALTAEARSAIYGYAFIWRLTESAPRAITGAPGGHSAHFEGSATDGTSTLRFVADVDVLPTFAGTLAVQGAAVTPTVQDARLRLDVAFDPASWWGAVDFDELAAAGGDPVVVPPTSRAYNALVVGMTSTDRPRFTWTHSNRNPKTEDERPKEKTMSRTRMILAMAAVSGLGATGCGDGGPGSAQIFVEGEDTIVNGLDPRTELENVKDGWTVRYDKFLITLGNFRASQSKKPTAKLTQPKTFVLDMRAIPSSGFLLAEFKDAEATRWDRVGYDEAIATATSTKGTDTAQADFDLMVSGGYSIYVAGTITKPDGQSCRPTAPTDCVAATTVRFAWGFPAATAADDCGPEDGDSGFAIPSGGTAQVKLTIHGDHIFFSNMNLGVELVDRLAQWIADADLNRDGETMVDELKMVQAADVFPAPTYNLSNAFGIGVRTAYDYAQTQERTIMHLQGEGDCQTPTVIP